MATNIFADWRPYLGLEVTGKADIGSDVVGTAKAKAAGTKAASIRAAVPLREALQHAWRSPKPRPATPA